MEHIHGLDVSWMTHGNPKGSQSMSGQRLLICCNLPEKRTAMQHPKSAWLTKIQLSRQGCEECDDTATIVLEFGSRLSGSSPKPGPQSPCIARRQRQSSDRTGKPDHTWSIELGEGKFG